MRVFLSHSSADKNIVGDVANRLGRSYVVYDAYSFETGEDLSNQILNGITAADAFVFFVSESSLASKWVKVELNAAAGRKLLENQYKVHTIVIDKNIGAESIPAWLKKSLYFSSRSSTQITREVQNFLFNSVSQRQSSLFIGRREEIERIEQLVTPQTSTREPHAFCLYGQTGIGRRSILRQLSGNLLGLPKQLEVYVESGDSINELVFSIHENIFPSKSNDLLKEKLSLFLLKSEAELRTIAEDLIQTATSARELFVLNDEGGFLDNDGFIRPDLIKFMDWLGATNGARAAIISRRRPATDVGTDAIPSVRIGPLSNTDVTRLLRRRLQQLNVSLSEADVRDIVPYIQGYPPAVGFITEVARRGEIQRLIASKAQLVNFTTSFMLREIERTGNSITLFQKSIMYILALYSPLPLRVLAEALVIDSNALDNELTLLFDLAFVIPVNNMVKLSDPLEKATLRLFSSSWNSHQLLADSISNYIDSSGENKERLSLARSLFRANSLAGNVNNTSGLALTSDFINVAQELYHERQYEQSIEFGKIALEQRPQNVDVISYLARAYIQIESYGDADILIKRLRELGHLRDHYFIEGFKERRQGNFGHAKVAYEKAIREGRKGTAVHRELAQCYLELGELRRAKDSIAKAYESDAGNKFVVDLEILIALRSGDRPLAEKGLVTLGAVDHPEYYFHRRSTFHYRFSEYKPAYEFATQAYEVAPQPSFAIISQLIKCAIAEEDYDVARERLNEAEQFRNNRYFDIRLGLKCKLETAENEFQAALGTWQRLRDKQKPVHLALKLAALEGKAASNTITAPESDEIDRLKKLLRDYDAADLDAFFGNNP